MITAAVPCEWLVLNPLLHEVQVGASQTAGCSHNNDSTSSLTGAEARLTTLRKAMITETECATVADGVMNDTLRFHMIVLLTCSSKHANL